jgi:hypothetical protein
MHRAAGDTINHRDVFYLFWPRLSNQASSLSANRMLRPELPCACTGLPPQAVVATSTQTCRRSPWRHGPPEATATNGRCWQTCRHSLRRHVPCVAWGRCRHREGGLFCQLYSHVVFFINSLSRVVFCVKRILCLGLPQIWILLHYSKKALFCFIVAKRVRF